MGEIRSLAVKQGYTKKGIGKGLVDGIFREASEFGIKSIFVLTYIPDFFKSSVLRRLIRRNYRKRSGLNA